MQQRQKFVETIKTQKMLDIFVCSPHHKPVKQQATDSLCTNVVENIKKLMRKALNSMSML